MSQAMSIALVNDHGNSNSGFDVANWSGGQAELLYHASPDTFDLSTHHHGGDVEISSNG